MIREGSIDYEDVVARLAPCGIDCQRCVRYRGGQVGIMAAGLAAALQGFENMAPKVADRVPALNEYRRFQEILEFFAQADCVGCRDGGCPLPFCSARTCFREQGADFCFECAEYPCDRNQYPENMARRWRACNDRMREIGAKRYYLESLKRPRY